MNNQGSQPKGCKQEHLRGKKEFELILWEGEEQYNLRFNLTMISELINKSFRTLNKQIKKLVKAGLIERRGSRKTGGYWRCKNEK